MQLSIKIGTFFLCLLLPTTGKTQKDYVQIILDSLVKETNLAHKAKLHNDLGFHFGSFDSLKADYHTRIAMEIAKENNLTKEKANAYKNLGIINGHLQYQEQSLAYYDSAYYFYEVIRDTSGLVAVLNNSGRRNCYLGNCELGIQKYQQAEKWVNSEKTKVLLSIRINHGICLMECKAYEQCLQICKRSIELAKTLDNPEYQFHFHYLMGNSLASLDRNQSALYQFDQAMRIAEHQQDPDKKVHILNDRVKALLKLGQFEEAYQDALRSKAMKEAQDLMRNDFRVYLNLAEAAKATGRIRESLTYYEIGLRGAEVTVDNVILAENYEKAAAAYSLADQHKMAYELMLKAKAFRDSVFTDEMRQNLQVLTTRYETEKIKNELAASRLKVEQERNRTRLTLISGSSLLILCGIGYLFFRGRQRRQQLEQEKRKVELEYGLLRAQMNPHFVFNSLNSIQGYFADNQFVQGNEFLGKFSRLIRRVLDQSVAPAIPLSEELATLKLYLDVEKIRLEHKLHYDIQIDQNVEVDFISVPPLVLQPFVENAIWHGIAPKKGKGTISIHCKMSENDQFLNVVISDDGVGLSPKLPQTKAHQSKGIKITEERLGKMGSVAIFDRQTEGKKGVKVQLVIPTSDQI